MDNVEELLKLCCKDAESFEKLKAVTDQLKKEKQSAEQKLELLERSVRNDYDSIMITTLNLENPEIVYVNKAFTEITGYRQDEVIGQSPKILQGPETDREVLDKLKRRLQKGRAFFGQTVNYRKDGSEFINQWDVHPLLDEKGQATHWISYQHDITERKRSEIKLLDTQVEFDQLVEESKKILVDVDEKGQIITSNKAFRDFLGYKAEELNRMNLTDLVLQKHHKTLGRLLNHGAFGTPKYELEIKNKQGQQIEVYAATRLLKPNGKTIIRVALENRTIQKRIEKMLSRQLSKLEKIFDSEKKFSYTLVPQDNHFIVQHVSDGFTNLTNIAPKRILELPFCELVDDRDVEKVKTHHQRVYNGDTHTEQFCLKNKGGGITEVTDYAIPVWGRDQKSVIAIKGTVSAE